MPSVTVDPTGALAVDGKQVFPFGVSLPPEFSTFFRALVTLEGTLTTLSPGFLVIEAAHRLIRCEERWTALAAKLSSRGKPAGVVIAAVANRWIRWLFHQMQPACLAA